MTIGSSINTKYENGEKNKQDADWLDSEHGPEKVETDEPKDRYHLIAVLFFFSGMIQTMPTSFIGTAHAYWMYKFRDAEFPDYDPDNLSSLSKNFNTCLSVVAQGSAIIMSIGSLFFAHRLSHRVQSSYTLIGIILMYCTLVAMIKVNTDDWQLAYLVMVLISVSITTLCSFLFAIYSLTLIGIFSTTYLGPQVVGQSISAIFSSVLQVATLSIGTSNLDSAFIYFSVGTVLIASVLAYLLLIEKYNKLFNLKMNAKPNFGAVKEKERMLTIAECWHLLKKIWPLLLNLAGYLLTLEPLHPSVTSIIGSVNQNNHHKWNEVYFIPVIGFMLPAICEITGKLIAFMIKDIFPIKVVLGFSLLRPFIFIPLITLCNIPNKKHLPVVFDEDYQYILIMIAYGITNGYSLGMTTFMLPKLIKPEEYKDAIRVLMVFIGVLLACGAYLGFITVNLI